MQKYDKVRHLDNGGGWGQSANVKTDSLKKKIKMQQKLTKQKESISVKMMISVNKNVVLKNKQKNYLIGICRIYLKVWDPGKLSIF